MRRSMRFLLIAAALVVFGRAPLAHAAGVVSTCDEGHLKAALTGGGLVTFSCSGVITLTSTIVVSANTSIDGSGQSVTISGGGIHQVMHVSAGTSLSLTNLTISGGSSDFGGGVRNFGGLTVNGCTFQNNIAFRLGGAISNEGLGVASLSNSSFTGNFGTLGGGAIATSGRRLGVTSSTFNGNEGTGVSPQGGAIWIATNGLATVLNSTFTNNSSTLGGAIYSEGTLSAPGNTFTKNTALKGGGIATAGLTSIAGSTFSGNHASNTGGAVYQFVTLSVSPPLSSNAVGTSQLSGNSAPLGGAIANEGGTLIVTTSTLSGNSATLGGGIASDTVTGPAVTRVESSTFLQNGASSDGGGIENEGQAQLFVTDSTLTRNSASNGGGINNASSFGQLVVTNSTFFANEALHGGAINNNSNAGTVSYSTLFGNPFVCIPPFCPPLPIINLLGGAAPLTLESTILAGSSSNCQTAPIDGDYNLDSGSTCKLSKAHSLSKTNPGIATSLAFNGGPTETLAVPTGSIVIDKIPLGSNGCGTSVTSDQRGAPRPLNGKCDIGAVEHLFTNVPVSGTSCDGVYNKTFDGDITVLPGQSCVFIGGGIIGNVDVKGGHFALSNATVGGDVEIEGDSTFAIGLSATINGSLKIHGLEPEDEESTRRSEESRTSERENHDTEPGKAKSRVCGSNVHGDLDIHNSEADIAIGSRDVASCPGNTIGGDVRVRSNSGSISIDGNTITGDLEDENNRGLTEVFNNVVKGILECRRNTRITGGLDFAKRKQGQCARF